MTNDNIGYAVVSPVVNRKIRQATATEIVKMDRSTISPCCAPSRSGFFQNNFGIFKEEVIPTGATHVGMVHYFLDCGWLTGPKRYSEVKPITADVIDFLGIGKCKKCLARLEREMPNAEVGPSIEVGAAI